MLGHGEVSPLVRGPTLPKSEDSLTVNLFLRAVVYYYSCILKRLISSVVTCREERGLCLHLIPSTLK